MIKYLFKLVNNIIDSLCKFFCQVGQKNPFWCRCNRGFIVERKSWQDGSRGRLFYACPLSVVNNHTFA